MVKTYSGVVASSHICCSSSRDYFALITPLDRDGKQFAQREYLVNGRCFVTSRTVIYRPHYLIEMVIGALQKLDLVVYEFDRDGNRRYTDLRYGSLAELRYLIGIGPDPHVSTQSGVRAIH